MLPELVSSKRRRPNAVFETPEDVRRICDAASQRLEELAVDCGIAAVIVQRFLSRIPDSSLGISSRVRAFLVIRSLHLAAKCLDSAAGHSAGTYYALIKHFAQYMEEGEE